MPGDASSPIYADEAGEDDVIDLRELFDYLVRGKWLIAGVTLGLTALGLAYAILATPIYNVDALLQIEEREGNPMSAAAQSELSFLMQGSTPAETELQIINSRSILLPVIRNLRLHIDIQPNHFPLFGRFLASRHQGIGPAEPVLGLDSFAWGGEELVIAEMTVPDAMLGKDFTLVSKGDGSFVLLDPEDRQVLDGEAGRRLTASLDGIDGLPAGSEVTLQVDRIVARPDTEFSVTRYHELTALERLRESFSVAEVGQDTSVIDLNFRSDDPARGKAVLDKITTTYLETNVQRNSAQAEERLAFIERQIPNVREDLRQDEARLATYSAEEGTVALSEQAKGLIEQYADVQSRLTELTLEKQVMQTRFTENHPRLRALNEQIADIREELSGLDARLRSLPRSEQEFVQLQRDVTVGNELYLQLLSTMQELRVMKAGEIGNVRIIDTPVEPVEPVSPNKPLIAVLSVLLGGFLGVGLALAREILHRGVEDPDKLEQAVGLPIYAVVPHSERQEKLQRELKNAAGAQRRNILLSATESSDIAVEALRSLRTSMQFALMEADNNIVLITGPAQGIGKSFTSVNLSVVTAQSGKRVLLIDADMRRGELNRYFGLARDPGLSQAISGEASWESVVNSTEVEGLDMITTGLLPPNPSELLMNETFAQGLKKLSEAYDVVIVDTPPVLAVTDALIAARQAGTIFMVLKSGLHSMREIQHSIARMDKNGLRPNGLIFNDLPRSGTQRYGYYHYSYQ